uniref:Protein kinase domain-containing protein n=1 Tax=Romanomermis culicivorax TaxID=13658 RepID=A0A915J728_ROMCU
MDEKKEEKIEQSLKICNIYEKVIKLTKKKNLVKRCVHRASGQEFAVKFVILRRVGTSRRGAKRTGIERKIEILGKLGSHGTIVHLQDVLKSAIDVILILG